MTASSGTSITLTPLPRGKNQSLSFVTATITTKRTQYPANIPPKYIATLPLPSLTGSRKGYAINGGQQGCTGKTDGVARTITAVEVVFKICEAHV